MGKSTCAAWLRSLGLPVVDTDDVARQLVEPGSVALAEIRVRFGEDVVDAAGRLRRDVVARRVFGDAVARRDLEAILHPRIRSAWRLQAAGWESAGAAAGVVVIPLLFETGSAPAFDVTVCVACTLASQRERLAQRGWLAEEIERRVAAQWPVSRKVEAAGHVIWTEGPLALMKVQWTRLWSRWGFPVSEGHRAVASGV